MSEAPKHSIGDEIPYRRDRIDKPTGSLVFDQHLKEKVAETGEPLVSDKGNPLKQGQVG